MSANEPVVFDIYQPPATGHSSHYEDAPIESAKVKPKLTLRLMQLFGIGDPAFFFQSEDAIQKQSQATLRQAAINHLRYGTGVVARSFRGEYLATGQGKYEDFLQTQSKNGEWGTYIEAAALGELTGCNVVVTPIKNGIQQNPIVLYRAEDPTAPTVSLYNSNNTHWFVNRKTAEDGNCLYNAFAQAYQQAVKQELRFVENVETTTTQKATQIGMFKTHSRMDQAAIAHQIAINQAIANHATPSEMEASLLAEQARINRLPPERQQQVRQQIASDYQYALSVARQGIEPKIFQTNSTVNAPVPAA